MTADESAVDPVEILTKKEVAERLKVSVRKVEDLHLPTLRLGSRCNRYIWSEVVKHLQANNSHPPYWKGR